MEAKVLVTLALHAPYSGLTTHEIAELSGIEYGSVTPRIRPLVKKGLVKDSGERRIPAGRTKAGIVWRAV
jgi:DNA-binding MarR family transcriptional regulator